MDNHNVNIGSSGISCGILTLSRPEADTRKVLYQIASHLYHPSRGTPAAMVIWSDLPRSNGAALFGAIQEMFGKDGTSHVGPVENPITSNDIMLFSWVLPHEKFRQFYRDERVARAKKA